MSTPHRDRETRTGPPAPPGVPGPTSEPVARPPRAPDRSADDHLIRGYN